MSVLEGSQTFIFNSQIGNVVVAVDQVRQYNVEDIVHDKAMSQAMAIKFLNISKDIDENIPLPRSAIPAVFRNTDEELPD